MSNDGVNLDIDCPFCNENVLYHHKGDMDEFDTSFCKHTIFAHCWGYDHLSGDDTHVHSRNKRLDARIHRYLERDSLGDPKDLIQGICAIVKKTLPKDTYKIHTACEYIERNDGLRGGGPTYSLVFLKRLPRAAYLRQLKALDGYEFVGDVVDATRIYFASGRGLYMVPCDPPPISGPYVLTEASLRRIKKAEKDGFDPSDAYSSDIEEYELEGLEEDIKMVASKCLTAIPYYRVIFDADGENYNFFRDLEDAKTEWGVHAQDCIGNCFTEAWEAMDDATLKRYCRELGLLQRP